MNNEQLRAEIHRAINSGRVLTPFGVSELLNRCYVALGEQQSVPEGWRSSLEDAALMLEAHSPGSGSVESYAAQDIRDLLAAAPPPAQSVPGSSAMTKLTIDRELLEELRDAANEAHNEATRPNRMKFFAALVEKADAILDAPSAPAAQGGE